MRVSVGTVFLGAFWVALAQGAVASMTVGPEAVLLFGALLFVALLVEYGPRGLLGAALLAPILVIGFLVLLFLLAPPATPWLGGGR